MNKELLLKSATPLQINRGTKADNKKNAKKLCNFFAGYIYYQNNEMKTQTFLHIYNPCNENWNKMTPLEQGRFCDKCAHQVMDFTVMTDQEVMNYIKNNNGMTCGRLHIDQLQRALHDIDRKKKKGWQLVVAGVTSLLFSVGKTQAQKKVVKEEPKAGLLYSNQQQNFANNFSTEEKTIKGKILNAEQEAIINAYVLNPSTLNKVFVNRNGEFIMQVESHINHVLAGAKGFDSRVVPTNLLNNADTAITLTNADTIITNDTTILGNVEFNDKNIFMGGITTFTEVEKTDTIKTFVKKIFNNSFFKISPNPADKTGFNISVKQEGTYTVQIFDNNSKLIHVAEITINAKGQIVFVSFPYCVVKGTYFVRLIDKKTKKQYTDKMIVR